MKKNTIRERAKVGAACKAGSIAPLQQKEEMKSTLTSLKLAKEVLHAMHVYHIHNHQYLLLMLRPQPNIASQNICLVGKFHAAPDIPSQ